VTVSPNDLQKLYYIVNNSDQTVTMSQGSGTTVAVDATEAKIMYCDGAGAGASVVDLTSKLLSTGTLADLGITASAAELNIMDGVTATTAELNIMDGVTAATTAEINVLDGFTGSTADLNEIAGAATTGIGKILQVVQGVIATNAAVHTETYVDIGLSASITPSSASNKILAFVVVHGQVSRVGDNAGYVIQLLRDETQIAERTIEIQLDDQNASKWINYQDGNFINLDSPATTSAITYSVEAYHGSGSGTSTFYAGSTITLMEVAA
jgi:hypothetical protein